MIPRKHHQPLYTLLAQGLYHLAAILFDTVGYGDGTRMLPINRNMHKCVARMALIFHHSHAMVLKKCSVSGQHIRSEEHTSELQSRSHLIGRPLLEETKASTSAA